MVCSFKSLAVGHLMFALQALKMRTGSLMNAGKVVKLRMMRLEMRPFCYARPGCEFLILSERQGLTKSLIGPLCMSNASAIYALT